MIRAARRLGVCLLLGGSVWAAPAVAQFSGPAETPPATFRGDQYVDSSGCVFIRTGIDGNTRWVPRVNRDRTPVCGARPSAATPPVRAAAPVIRRTPAPAAPREIEAARPVAPAPQPTRARAPAPVRTAAPSAPRPVTMPRPAASAPMQAANLPPGCGATALSARYIPGCAAAVAAAQTAAAPAPEARPAVAPGLLFAIARPEQADASAVARVDAELEVVRIDPTTPSPNRSAGPDPVRAPAPASLPSGTRVVVVPAARTTFDVSTPPRGYRTVWEDGRLNPNRGPQTLQGDYQSRAIWTDEAPRRLRDRVYTTR